MEIFVLCLVAAAVSAGVGSYVSDAKGRGRAEGAWFGALLGPFGVLIAALMPPAEGRDSAREEPAEEGEDAAAGFLAAIPKGPEKPSDFLDRIGDVTLSPEERERKEREAIRSLRTDLKPPE